MYDAQWDLKGFDRVIGKMRSLPVELRRKGGRAALRAAAVVVQKAAQENARRFDDPRSPSQIYKNIAVRWSSKVHARTGDLAFRVGIIGGAGVSKKRPAGSTPSGPGGDTRHWFYKEFGTEHMMAEPFMRPALANNIEKVTYTFADRLEAQIDKIVKANQ